MRPACFFAACALSASAVAAESVPPLILCPVEDGDPVTIDLAAPSDLGQTLICVSAPGLYDLTPCAPDGGWGLSAATGLARLVEVTGSWNEAASYPWGRFHAYVAADRIVAAASFGEGLPGTAEAGTIWSMEVSRLTGEGVMRTEDGEIALRCETRARRL